MGRSGSRKPAPRAVHRSRVARNVCTLVAAPSLHRREVEPLRPEPARRLLDAAKLDRNAARWSIALALGLRQGQALGLTWNDIDFDSGSLTVRRALQRLKGQGLVMVEPKSQADRRTIALPASLRRGLQTHRQEREYAAQPWQEHDLVFAQVDGKPIDPRADWRAWKALLVRAEVRDARLHDARHTAATLLLQQGVPARVAMQVLGHSQISLTLGTYSHVVPALARKATARMETARWGEAQQGPEEDGVKTAPAKNSGAIDLR